MADRLKVWHALACATQLGPVLFATLQVQHVYCSHLGLIGSASDKHQDQAGHPAVFRWQPRSSVTMLAHSCTLPARRLQYAGHMLMILQKALVPVLLWQSQLRQSHAFRPPQLARRADPSCLLVSSPCWCQTSMLEATHLSVWLPDTSAQPIAASNANAT